LCPEDPDRLMLELLVNDLAGDGDLLSVDMRVIAEEDEACLRPCRGLRFIGMFVDVSCKTPFGSPWDAGTPRRAIGKACALSIVCIPFLLAFVTE